MIEIRNLRKKYNNRFVIDDISLIFPRTGFVAINGPSGCGKTTLLNIIATLLDFEGEVIFEGKRYSRMSVEQKERFRCQKIGFIFQDYKLFEFETVKENIALAIDISCGDKKVKKEKRIKDLLKLVNLSIKENELVSNLSGGEKQRTAIARAIANSPKIILADEPTGNLDEENTKDIIKILKTISDFSLVIMVSHDKTTSKEYADQIIEMRDGKIVNIVNQYKENERRHLPVMGLSYRTYKNTIPFNFMLKHTFNSVKRRKWRTMFITFITSIGLIGVGQASTLSNIISTNLYRSYTSILDDDRLVLSNKEVDSEKDIVKSASFDEVMSIYNRNLQDVEHVGVFYLNDFDQMFTTNDVAIDTDGVRKPINGLSLKYINEFKLLEGNEIVFPETINILDNNEFILSGPFSIVNEICYQLQIERTMDSFSHYLRHYDVYLSFKVENYNWTYEGSFLLKLSGFILSNRVLFYHSNPIWNEYVLETKLTLPTTDKLNVISEHPWDLRKCYYLSFKYNRGDFLTRYRFDYNYRDLDFEILDSKYYPNLLINYPSFECPRTVVVNRSKKDIVPSYIGEYCKEASKHVKKIIYGSSNAYAIYDKNLMAGFARNAYLSTSEESIEDVIDLLSYVKYEDAQKIQLPNNTIEGHFSKSNLEGLVFEPNYNLLVGREPINYQEIVISSALADKLNIVTPINQDIYFTFPVTEVLLSNGYITRNFKNAPLKIVGVSDSAKLAIHHIEEWSLMFFQTMLGMSTFELSVENLSIQINKKYESNVIKHISRAFPQYEISSPFKDVRDSVNKICHYVEVILLVVSMASVIIASLILFICNYLHFLEAKKDIGLVRCLGLKEMESRKLIYAHSLMMTLFSLALSILELLVISLILSKTISNNLHITQVFVLNPMSILYMVLMDLFIAIVSSILISLKIKKYTPLECLNA